MPGWQSIVSWGSLSLTGHPGRSLPVRLPTPLPKRYRPGLRPLVRLPNHPWGQHANKAKRLRRLCNELLGDLGTSHNAQELTGVIAITYFYELVHWCEARFEHDRWGASENHKCRNERVRQIYGPHADGIYHTARSFAWRARYDPAAVISQQNVEEVIRLRREFLGHIR